MGAGTFSPAIRLPRTVVDRADGRSDLADERHHALQTRATAFDRDRNGPAGTTPQHVAQITEREVGGGLTVNGDDAIADNNTGCRGRPIGEHLVYHEAVVIHLLTHDEHPAHVVLGRWSGGTTGFENQLAVRVVEYQAVRAQKLH